MTAAGMRQAWMIDFGKRLSCGIVVLSPRAELLLCHVTGRDRWDLPKGGRRFGESAMQAALRETREETGLELSAAALRDLGRFDYGPAKDLHLFATRTDRFDVAGLHCDSHFWQHFTGRRLPEMDGYGWFGFERIGALCPPKLAAVLTERLDLPRLSAELRSLQRQRPRTARVD